MRIQKCYFCSGPVYPGHGTLFIRNDCRSFRFCRAKCHKHFKAKHNPRKCAWTKAYRKLNNKQIAKDSILQFEQVRNEPVQYNREVYVKTIQAMKKIADIRKKRQDRFWRNRMKLSKIKKVKAIAHELQVHGDLMENQQLRQKKRENLRERLAKQETKKGVMTIEEE